MSTYDDRSFNRFAWVLAKSLTIVGVAWARCITTLVPKTPSLQLWVDRILHLNEVLGYFVPSLTYVMSRALVDGNYFVFRPFTDDADKVSETYESRVRELISPHQSDVIIDVGANIGVHTVWLSRKVGPSGMVLAVEPERTNFTILNWNKRVNNLANVLSFNLALASKQAEGKLLVPRPTLMGQANTVMSKRSSKSSEANIRIQTLDNLIDSCGASHVSAIKVDVEGAEVSVIQGAEKTIAKFGPRLVIEAHGEENIDLLRTQLESMRMKIVAEIRASSRPDENRMFMLAIPSRDR